MRGMFLLTGLLLLIAAGIGIALINVNYNNKCYCSSINNNFTIKDIKK
jgi:hypothetical protein